MFYNPINCRRLEEQVVALEKKPVQTGKILFYGDDLFAGWENILEDKESYVNHGLMGATAEDLLYYYGRLVRPYKPKMLVISFGYRDIGYGGWGYSPEEAMSNLNRIVCWAKTDFPGIQILLTELTPLVQDRWVGGSHDNDNWVYSYNVNDRFNELMRLYAGNTKDLHILTFWDKEVFFETPEDVGQYRKLRIDLSDEDGYYNETHYNAAGYAVMESLVRPAVEEVLHYV